MDINKLMKEAQAMQKQMEKISEEISASEFEGTASNGLVKVTVNGDDRVTSVKIDPSILNPEDVEMIEDLIMIATNNAIELAYATKEEKYAFLKNYSYPK